MNAFFLHLHHDSRTVYTNVHPHFFNDLLIQFDCVGYRVIQLEYPFIFVTESVKKKLKGYTEIFKL